MASHGKLQRNLKSKPVTIGTFPFPHIHTHNRAKFNPVVENKGTGMMERNDFFLQKSKSSGGDWYFCLKKLTVDLKANKKMFQGEYLC